MKEIQTTHNKENIVAAVEKSGLEGTWLYTKKYLDEIIGF